MSRYRLLMLVSLALIVSACQAQPPALTDTASPVPPTPTEELIMIKPPELEHIRSLNGGDTPFDAPYGVDVSADGQVYVFDAKNQRVRVFDNAGEERFEWGEPGEGPGQFNSLGFGSLALDPDGNVFVVDNGNFRVQKFDSQGNFIQAFGGEGEGSGDFTHAIGIAVGEGGNVYVTDDTFPFVQIFDNQGNFLRQFGGKGSGPGQFEHATGISLDRTGHIYVADYSLKRVQVFDRDGSVLKTIEIGLDGPFPGTPEGISVDGLGRIYISDYDRGLVEVLSQAGEFMMVFGEAELRSPVDIAIGSDGLVYVTDQRTSLLQIYLTK
jgi:DNA-binding beta-propeller fold protein YncE